MHIDSMLGESARLQLLKNVSEEREAMLAQAAIHIPKGETRKRAQITYLIAKVGEDTCEERIRRSPCSFSGSIGRSSIEEHVERTEIDQTTDAGEIWLLKWMLSLEIKFSSCSLTPSSCCFSSSSSQKMSPESPEGFRQRDRCGATLYINGDVIERENRLQQP